MNTNISLDLIDIFEKNKEKNAIWIKGHYYSYQQLACKIRSILEVMPEYEESIGILAFDSFETYSTLLASIISGNCFIPISPSYPTDRVNNILNQTHITTVFTSQEYSFENKAHPVNFVNTSCLESESSDILSYSQYNGDKTACILFTSGSTGNPKGVPMTFKNIAVTLDSYDNLYYGPFNGYKCLQMFEFTFDMSMLSYLPAFRAGACIYSIVDDKLKYLNAFKIIKEFELDFAVFVPSTLAFMQKYFNNFLFPHLKCCMVGGEPFQLELAQSWMKCIPNGRLVNISGPTETTMACMGYEINNSVSKLKNYNGVLAFGRPWKNTTAIVLNNQNRIALPFEKGELCFAGENVMKSYYNDAEKSNNAFISVDIDDKNYKFYKTGDGAYMDDEGDYFTTGRIDFQVKIQGYRVEPGEIENVAREFVLNNEIIAIPYVKHDGFYSIGLFIECDSFDKEGLLSQLKNKLPPYMIPDKIVLLKKFPLNINGKIDRQFLKSVLEKNNINEFDSGEFYYNK